MEKLFVWDFHGVLEKGNDAVVLEFTNQTLEAHGYSRRMTLEESEFLSGRRWYEYFSHLIPEIDIDKSLELQSTALHYSNSQPQLLAKLVSRTIHADHVLEAIAQTNHTQILISNSHPEILDMFVELVGVEKYFPKDYRFGVNSNKKTNMNKLECLRQFVQDKHFPGGIVSIGDSPTDMALIHNHPKGTGYLYTHPGKTHRDAQCHYKINDLRHVLQELN